MRVDLKNGKEKTLELGRIWYQTSSEKEIQRLEIKSNCR